MLSLNTYGPFLCLVLVSVDPLVALPLGMVVLIHIIHCGTTNIEYTPSAAKSRNEQTTHHQCGKGERGAKGWRGVCVEEELLYIMIRVR